MKLALLLILLVSIPGCLGDEKATATIGQDKVIRLEIAKTPEERAKGLMFRESLGENEGMLFVFEAEGYHAFWMKNVNFPLDILWLDRDLRVIHISPDTPPCTTEPCATYTSLQPAKYVLEVNANFTTRHGIKPGSQLFLDVSKIEK